jgi:flagellum-specific peptidoglycan hydrolase FlgJ
MSNFYTENYKYAKTASEAIDIPVSVILAQWANESARGTSELYKNSFNMGGIKKVGTSIASGSYTMGSNTYAKYSSKDQFVQDYIRVMKLGYYDEVRKAGTVEGTLKALGESKYAGSGYAGKGQPKGTWLLDLINAEGLRKYDSGVHVGSSSNTNEVETLSETELKKYATIGLAAVAFFALLSGK